MCDGVRSPAGAKFLGVFLRFGREETSPDLRSLGPAPAPAACAQIALARGGGARAETCRRPKLRQKATFTFCINSVRSPSSRTGARCGCMRTHRPRLFSRRCTPPLRPTRHGTQQHATHSCTATRQAATACDCTSYRPAESGMIGTAATCSPARRAAGTLEGTRLAARES